MTTHWADMQNADVILNIGSNSAENHPVSSKWLNKEPVRWMSMREMLAMASFSFSILRRL